MAWCQTGTKPLPEPMLTQFPDIYVEHVMWCYKAPQGLNGLSITPTPTGFVNIILTRDLHYDSPLFIYSGRTSIMTRHPQWISCRGFVIFYLKVGWTTTKTDRTQSRCLSSKKQWLEIVMMTSWQGHTFCITGHLWGESMRIHWLQRQVIQGPKWDAWCSCDITGIFQWKGTETHCKTSAEYYIFISQASDR